MRRKQKLGIDIKGKNYLLTKIYVPNNVLYCKCIVDFFESLRSTLKHENQDEEENIIMAGDFNCPPNPAIDKKGGTIIPRNSVVSSINYIQEEFDLVDI